MSGLRVFDDVWERVELPIDRQRSVGWSLMSRVIEQQLTRGASVVGDLVARDPVVDEWRELAARFDAQFSVIECLCSSIEIHQSRVDGRQRNIPGWYELSWPQVERGRTWYPPLTSPKLVLDAVSSLESNLTMAIEYVNR